MILVESLLLSHVSLILWTAALNLGHSNLFCYLQDNHTSVVGVRDVAIKKGGVSACVSPDIICSSTIPNDGK